MCTISLCMIIKNEENNIRRCLESAIPLIDELIIVDTGSSDNTKKICESFNAQIYDYTWSDNFSDARNYCISKASSDWILWLDADEELIITNIKNIKDGLTQSSADIYTVQIKHPMDFEFEKNNNYYISYHQRLFRNRCGFYFRGSIHETLINDDMEKFRNSAIIESIIVHHYGYLDDRSIDKSLRNIKLLLKEKELQPDNPWTDYHIAAELYRLKDINRAFTMINKSIAGFIAHNLLPPALAYKLKYDILSNYGNQENTLIGINKSIELYPDYVDLYFYKGFILYNLRLYKEAIKTFQKCIILGEFNPKYLIQSGTGSFRAYYYIGKCYEQLDKKDFAKESFRQSLLSNPGYRPALEQLNNMK